MLIEAMHKTIAQTSIRESRTKTKNSDSATPRISARTNAGSVISSDGITLDAAYSDEQLGGFALPHADVRTASDPAGS